MLYINVKLALACCLIVPAIVLISQWFSEKMRDVSKRTQVRRHLVESVALGSSA